MVQSVNFPRNSHVLRRFPAIKFAFSYLELYLIAFQFQVVNLHFITYFAYRRQSPDGQQPIKKPKLLCFEKQYFSLRSIYFHLFEERRPANIFVQRLLEIKYSFLLQNYIEEYLLLNKKPHEAYILAGFAVQRIELNWFELKALLY